MSNAVHLLPNAVRLRKSTSVDFGLCDIRAVAVLFLSTGRNAWHSTWIRRYLPGEFFRDGHAVAAAVEKRKTRGTVFYLSVMPAFQVNYGNRRFLLTEINTLEPFRNIVIEEVRYGLAAANLNNFLKLVVPPSKLWKSTQAVANHIILQEVEEDYVDLHSYTMLARGRGGACSPSLGRYQRHVTGTFLGESEWDWSELAEQKMSARWFNKALEAWMESILRLKDYRV